MGMAGPRIIAQHVERATALKNPQQNNKTGRIVIIIPNVNFGNWVNSIG